jgi:hypothetical protein
MILSRNFDIKKRYTNSKNNLMKTPNILKPYVLYTIITIVISFLISIAGTYLGCFIINSSDYYSIRILFFNGYGYLLMIGIALITCGISLLVLFRKKKTNKV